MKILKTIPVRDGLKNWLPLQKGLVAGLRRDEVEVVWRDMPGVTVREIEQRYEADLVAGDHIVAAIQAEHDGFDAVALGCLLEPGVDAAREAVAIPVVGELQAAIYVAALLGRRFSVLLCSERGTEEIRNLVHRYGLGSKLASIRCVNASPLAFACGHGGAEGGLREAMLEAARRAIREDGADTIIGYGGPDVIGHLRCHLDVPVVSPIQASIAVAEMLVRLGLSHSKRAYPRPSSLASMGD